jgi:dTDP-4-amino-4,6-dideoxygalactose transaminase
MMISPANPKASYDKRAALIKEALCRVLESGVYLHGDETKGFESEFAHYVGARVCLGVGSGTQALYLALRCFDVGPGDEVIMPAHTATASLAAVALTGARAVLVDVDAESFTLDVEAVKKAWAPQTKAIMPVHLYGHPAKMDVLMAFAREKNLRVVEDCAQAHGAEFAGQQVGSFGDIGCFSFYPTKNLGAFGDAGALVFREDAFVEKAKALREYGWKEKFKSELPGVNARMDELHAAVLRVKLKSLNKDNACRREIAKMYSKGLKELDLMLPQIATNSTHVFHQYVVRSVRRDALRSFLHDKGIGSGVHYPYGLHQQPGFNDSIRVSGSLACTERMLSDIVSLPMYPELSEEDVRCVIDAIHAFYYEGV